MRLVHGHLISQKSLCTKFNVHADKYIYKYTKLTEYPEALIYPPRSTPSICIQGEFDK